MTAVEEVVDMRNGDAFKLIQAPGLTVSAVRYPNRDCADRNVTQPAAAGEKAESDDRIWRQVRPKIVPEIVPVEG